MFENFSFAVPYARFVSDSLAVTHLQAHKNVHFFEFQDPVLITLKSGKK